MQENMKEYLTEKEAKEKRLEVYTEKIQEKVLSRSSETIRQLVEPVRTLTLKSVSISRAERITKSSWSTAAATMWLA